MSEVKRYETRKQVAERTGISERLWEKEAQAGTGPVMCRVGRRVLYEPEAVDAWLAERRCRSTSGQSARRTAGAAR